MPELDPGSTGRRWEPDGGVNKLNDQIHRESRFVDEHKNMPFSFSKPTRPKKSKIIKCGCCGYVVSVPKNTVGMICKKCNKYVSVEGVVVDD